MADEGFVRTSAGDVHYVRDGQGAPLVLLHSNGNSWHEYDRVSEALAAEFDVVRWDMPGQGDSGPLVRDLSIDDYADAVIDLISGLRIERPLVVGASVGGCIVASLGARHAAKVRGIGIVETQYRDSRWWDEAWLGIERIFSVPAQTPEQVQARFFSAAPELVERVNIDRAKAGGRAMMSAMWAIRRFDIAGAVHAITAPTLLVFGTAGPTLETSHLFREALPSTTPSDYVVIEGAGHFPMIDHPQEFVTAVRSFTAGPQR